MTQLVTEQGAVATKGGRLNIQLITPGWGSSGYYPPQVLEQAAQDQVFAAGTHMYLDHPTSTEDMERPNRSVKDLAAVLLEDARWDGQALTAPVRTFGPFGPVLADMKDAIGVSIRADAEVSEGEAEGRRGVVIERIANARSVDFVTAAGRGGKILQVLESARNQVVEAYLSENTPPAPAESPEPAELAATPEPETPAQPEPETPAATSAAEPAATADNTNPLGGNVTGTDQSGVSEGAAPLASRQIYEAKIAAYELEVNRLKAEAKARGVIAEDLANAIITPLIATRITEEVLANLPLVQGELDVMALRNKVAEKRDRAEREIGEAAQAMGFGTPKGLGAVAESTGAAANYEAQLVEQFKELGMSDSAAKTAAKGL